MNTEKLSQRLEMVAKYIPAGARLADIGSDHAYLPCHVVKKGIVPFAIAGEVAEGPYQSAKRQVEQDGLTKQIAVRKGDGLEVISPGEVDCITISGMGGALIAAILEQGKDKLKQIKRLVLQPNVSAVSIRKWFLDNEWELLAEEILMEDGKIYEILAAERGNPLKPYGNDIQAGLLLGPFLTRKQDEVFITKWAAEKANWCRILHQLEQGVSSEENSRKKQELLEKINIVEGALKDEKSERP